MKDDLLQAAARALADQSNGASESASFTRARVLASLHQSRLRRRTRLAFALPLAASFAAATAWGTVSGRAPALVRSVAEALGLQAPAPVRSQSSAKRPVSGPNLDPTPAPTPVVSPPSPDPEPLPSPAVPSQQISREATATGPASRKAESSPATAKPSNARSQTSATPIPDRAHSLYLGAHRAHFVDHDFTRALSAWDAYLGAAPSGRFAPEARYNRALCLARLGRHDEASAALLPFAEAPAGSYRKEEASALRAALPR